MEALAHNRQPPGARLVIGLWCGGALLAIVFGLAAATSVAAVAGVLVVIAAIAVVVAAFTETRWALLVLLFLLYSYAGWVVGHTLGGPEVSQALLMIIIAALVWQHLARTERFSLPGELIAVLILGAAFAASAAFTTDADASLRQIWDFIGYGLTVVAIVVLLDRPLWLRRAVWTVAVAGGALGLISLIQAVTGSYGNDFAGFAIARPEGAGVFRVGGPLDPNFFGQVLVATAVLAVYLALSTRERGGRVLALAILVVCIAATGFTGSRGALVATAAAFFLILILGPFPRDIGVAIAAVVVVAGLVFLPSGLQARVGLPTSSSASPEMTTVTRGSNDAIKGRKSENLAALQMFRDHPIFGVGPGNYSRHYLSYSERIGLDPRLAPREAHSLYLGALGETGIVGASALFAVLWLAVGGAWRARRRLRGRDALLSEGIFVSLVSFLVAGLFLHAAYPRYLWILVGFGFAAGQLSRKAAPSAAPAEPVTVAGPAVGEPQPATRPSRQRQTRRRRAPLVAAAVAIPVAGCIAIGLAVAGGGDRKPSALSVSPAEEPAPSLAAQSAHCDPIVGSGMANSGTEYTLTSLAPGGKQVDCGRARSIVLSALNGEGPTVSEWSCTVNPAGPTIATCISPTGAKIWARD